MRILPKATYTVSGRLQNNIERAMEIPPKVFAHIPTPLHVPFLIGGTIVAMNTLKQIPILIKAICNLFIGETQEKQYIVVMKEEEQKDPEEKKDK